MDRQYLLYTVKVWLSGVLVVPAIIAIIYWLPGSNDSLPGSAIITFYLLLAALEFMFSFFTWLTFWALTMLTIFYIDNRKRRRWLVFIIAIALTVITFAAFSWLMFSILFDSISLALMLINCVCIGCGAWFLYPTDLAELADHTPKLESDEQ
jgi:hypothetical protein